VPGLRVNVPPGGWQAAEDSPVEFKLLPPNAKSQDTPAIRFWIDPHASTPCSDKVLPVDLATPARAVRWLRGNKNLIVSAPRQTTIGGRFPALRVDLDVSATAPRCDPSCPVPCIGYFDFFGSGPPAPDLAPGHTPGVEEGYGTGRGEPVRLYFAEIAAPTHVLAVNVDTPNARVFARMTSVAAKLLASLRLPSKLPSRQGR
jgi:hypothetical protein